MTLLNNNKVYISVKNVFKTYFNIVFENLFTSFKQVITKLFVYI